MYSIVAILAFPILLIFLFAALGFISLLLDSDFEDEPLGSNSAEQEVADGYPAVETPVLDDFLARHYICADREKKVLEIFGNEYDLQRCSARRRTNGGGLRRIHCRAQLAGRLAAERHKFQCLRGSRQG